MTNTDSTKTKQYNQIYELLKSISYQDYISDKRNNIHQQIFDNAISKLIVDVNNETPKTKVGLMIKLELSKISLYNEGNIETFNNKNFQFIEYKNNNWIYPSKVSIFYTKELINDEFGNKIRLKLGPYSLEEFWETEYLTIINIGNMTLGEFYSNFEIEYVNYVLGNCKLYDKTNDRHITINLNYIQNQNLKYSDEYKNKIFGNLIN